MKKHCLSLALGMMLIMCLSCSNESSEPEPPVVLGTDLSLDKTSLVLDGGESCRLVATLASKEADEGSVTWVSSDENIALVDRQGNVRAVNSGVAVISAKADLQQDATCKVDVISDIYIAGIDDGMRRAVYWKNGRITSLTDGRYYAGAYAIAVSGNDIHVVGYEDVDGVRRMATYWKNGVPTYFGSGIFEGIAIVGNDVHIIGRCSGGWYWKNGKKVDLPDCGYVSSITTQGNDVYIAGRDNEYNYNCVYWKNGEKIIVGRLASASAITVCGDDVYLAGSNSAVQTLYWKNGQQQSLPDFRTINSMAVSGSDLYMVGHKGTNSYAAYWKNGVMTTLCNTSQNSDASSIAVAGDDVFIVGYEAVNFMDQSRFWKNGELIKLDDYRGKLFHSTAESIVVVRK